jgi:hypothetical protein
VIVDVLAELLTFAGVTAQARIRTSSWLIEVTVTLGNSAVGSVVIHCRSRPRNAGFALPTSNSTVSSSPSVWPNTSRRLPSNVTS